jgi:sterol desaturase/sphingolipid hydroxylase (fatty acid hydroxylase superfamily)
MLAHLGPQLQAALLEILRLSVWLALLAAIFVPLERLFDLHPQKVLRKQLPADLAYYFLSSLLPALALGAPAGLLAWGVRHAVPPGLLAATAALPLWARIAAGCIASEVGYYWGHRWSHEVPFLWGFHAIHHGAEEMDYLVNTRAHPVDMIFTRFCCLVPVYVLGLGGPAGPTDSLVPVAVTLIGAVWGFFIHANLRWRFGPLEWLVATPAFHHWHHTLTGPIDRNYASTFPWVDRLFGTHYLPGDWPESYGIKAKVPETLLGQLAYPLVPPPPAAPQPTAAEIPSFATSEEDPALHEESETSASLEPVA